MLKEINLKDFPSVSKEEWRVLAKNQLKGEDPAALSWDIDNGLSADPYYDSSDLEGLDYLQNFFKGFSPFKWKLYEEILVGDEITANEEALEALQGGCDGVIFNLIGQADSKILLKNVLSEICDISIRSTKQSLENDLSLSSSQAGFVYSNATKTALSIEENETQVGAIVKALQTIDAESHILRVASQDFFLEIASIRALRFLLSEIIGKDPWTIRIHTKVPLHPENDHQWFLNSTAGLASILGGTSSVNFTTAQGNSRISRNVGNIIREESGISTYTDQCGGSYFVDRLTHNIIQECKKRLN